MRFARGYRKFVANCVDSVLVLALKSPFTTIIIIIMGYVPRLSSKDIKLKRAANATMIFTCVRVYAARNL